MNIRDATRQIETKMEAAGLSAAAIRAFLYQYRKLGQNEAGVIPEHSIAPVESLPSIDEQAVPSRCVGSRRSDRRVEAEWRSRHEHGPGKSQKPPESPR